MNIHAVADQMNIPLRTLDQVKVFMTEAAKNGAALSAVRLMLRHGRITEDARAWLMRTYNQSE